MENDRFFKKISIDVFHLPTWLCLIGYLAYWVELYLFKNTTGRTTPLAIALGGIFVFLIFIKSLPEFKQSLFEFRVQWGSWDSLTRFLMILGVLLVIGILACAFYASLFPPHLLQETDILNYHITLPRQHLILNSFQHIPWAMADLYFLPVDFALTPYWLVTPLPNKFPQFLFIFGLLGVSVSLVRFLNQNNFLSIVSIIFAVLGSHHVGIQLGTGMLDLLLCYLGLACLDSLIKGHLWQGAIELTFYFWSKSFIPLQMIFISGAVFLIFYIFRKFYSFSLSWTLDKVIDSQNLLVLKDNLKKIFLRFILLSCLIGGPFIIKNIYYAGTPLYPLFPGFISINNHLNKETLHWQSIEEKAKMVWAIKDQYGSGRSLKDFLLHFWLIAVPQQGVNNRFDYPLGLVYLLCLAPFFYLSGMAFWKKQFPIIPIMVMLFWFVWWLGTQQTRYLFIPTILMYICVISETRFLTKTLLIAVTVALFLVSVSVIRAHRHSFGKGVYEVLRDKDKQLLKMSRLRGPGKPVVLNFHDAAFADFPIEVRGVDSIFVLDY